MTFIGIRTLLAYMKSNVEEGAIKPDVPLLVFDLTDKDYEKLVYELKFTRKDISVDALKELTTVGDLLDYTNRINNG